jgi:hypothetical protein
VTSRKVISKDGKKIAEMKLKNNHNFDYIGTLWVGNPPQPVRGCFDTGSANLWILSSHCNNKRCKPGSKNKYFTPEKSSSFKRIPRRRRIKFGSGSLSGPFGSDDVRVSLGLNEIHIKN